MENIADSIALRIRQSREALKITQVKLAYEISATGRQVAPNVVSSWEKNLEEVEALLAWLGSNVETMATERPLTKAVRKISMMIAGGIVPAELPADVGTAVASSDNSVKTAPTAKSQRPPHQPASLLPLATPSNRSKVKKK